MDGHAAFAILILAVAVASLGYAVMKNRHSKAIWRGLAEKREMAGDAWVEQQIQRWRDGELPAKLEKSPNGQDEMYVIEPLPEHKIVVASSRNGKSSYS